MIKTNPDAKVLMVSLPFGPLNMPSIGLSLLQACLKDKGIRSQCLYLTLPFAKAVGVELYNDITSGKPDSADMLGEWIFAESLNPGRTDADAYLKGVLRAGGKGSAETDALFSQALQARERATEFIESCAVEIDWGRYPVVGFTSIFQQNVASLALARRIKTAHPGVRIVFGGANVEGVMGLELLRNFPFVDAVVSGEGEVAFPALVEKLLTGEAPEGLPGVFTQLTCQREPAAGTRLTAPSPKSLDDLPHLDYDDYFGQLRESGLDLGQDLRLLFETSRGCWWGQKSHCTFCGLNSSNMAFRSKSQERALSELDGLLARYPGIEVSVVDNILDMSYFQRFLPALRDRGGKTDLFYEVKANLRKEQLRLMREAGISRIQPGIESLSSAVLKLMRKGTTGLQNVQLIKWCKELNIIPYWNILWGFPGEDPGEYEKMARWVPLLTHLPPPGSTAQLRLDRFSPNFDQSRALGFSNVKARSSYAHLYPGLDDESRHRLAYYFSFDYRDGRDPRGYVRPLQDAVRAWCGDYRDSEMISIETAEGLLVWDQRGRGEPRVWLMKGTAREVYESCDQIQGLRSVAARLEASGDAAREAEIALLAQAMTRTGLLLEDSGFYLALAVRFGGYALPEAVLGRIANALTRIGDGELDLIEEAPGLYRARTAAAEPRSAPLYASA
ncbi:MAG: RiPP maturation radical SAM C-methyltransferase [Elusimicrobiota bacterium]|nr:RiPP maturation radical SAM C-methyltransferase [Elusimicrobiota bacterium]